MTDGTEERGNFGIDFELKNITDFESMKVGEKINGADFSMMTTTGKFLQFKRIEKKGKEYSPLYVDEPGAYNVIFTMAGPELVKTQLLDDKILDEYTETDVIIKKVSCFFSNIDKYKKHNIFPKRGLLLYGAPGCGKTAAISKVCEKYIQTEKTAVLIWKTAEVDAGKMTAVIKALEFSENVNKFILVAEDLGGGEQEYKSVRHTDSATLALLDNSEKIFKVPTMILATTNYAGNLLGNIADRPQRFDDLIEVKPPSQEARISMLQFFLDAELSEEDREEISKEKYNEFSVAYLREIVIRADLYDVSLIESMQQLLEQKERFQNSFSGKKSMGIGL